jgi:hypothetical protein
MSPQEARALAVAYELQSLPAELAEQQEPGGRAEAALHSMDDVIGMLEPDAPPETLDVHPESLMPSC